MYSKKLAQAYRLIAIVIFSFAVISCGSGSGKDSVSASGGGAGGSQELRMVFEDDFGGPIGRASLAGKTALPASNWRVETGYGDNGWGNDEWQNYTSSTDNLYLENGALVISAQCSTGGTCSDQGVNKRTGAITSARINSKNKLHVRYGSVSARIKMPSGIGTWPAFWMLGADIDELRWPDAGEIDIVEMHYKFSDTRTTHFTTHWSAPNYAAGENPTCSGLIPGVNPGEQQHCFTDTKTFDDPLDVPITDDFHIFEVVWNENSIIGKIDGVTYYTLAIDSETMEEFQKDYFMILNIAVGGTLGGTPDASMDWTNPDQTNMLVDWVRVFERVQPDSSTLIDESGNNLPFNRIINSAEFGAAFVESDLESMAVTPLVGDQVLELDYATSSSPEGGATRDYSAAFFSFNRIDLSNFNNMIFSMDASQFANFDDVAIEFEDFNGGKGTVRSSDLTPVSTSGNWNTYAIPFSDFTGASIDDIKFLSFISPNDVNDNLIAGKLYLDDIRFSEEACTAAGVITFDSANYNSDTRVGAVNIDDICAAGSLASIEVDNGSEQISLGVKLDAAGKGRVTFGLVNGRSICLVDDQQSILPLSGDLTATYTKTSFEAATPTTVVITAQAGIDESAPGTTLVGEELFLYSTDQALTFLPDNDFAYSVFGSGSLLNGAASDATFNPSFGVTSGTGYGGGIHVAQIIWLGGTGFPAFTGFADGKQSLKFKIRDLPGNILKVEVGVAGAGVDGLDIPDVANSAFSTPIGTTGWYQIVIPFSEFPASSTANFIAITGGNNGTSGFTFLVTDVAVQESLSNVPASCEVLVPGPGTGSVPEVTIYEADGSTSDLSPGYDPFGSGTGIATVADTTFTQALELTVANGYGPSLAQLGLTGLSFTGFDEFLFKVKGLTADNTIRVTAEATGGGSITVDLVSAPSGVTLTNLGDGWTQVVIALTAFGDVSSASQVVFQTLDNAYSVGDTFLLTDIGFNNAAPNGQLAVNGDIETGDLSSWTTASNGGTITADNTQNSGSTWSVHVVAGPGNNPFISLAGLAAGTVVPGDTIDVSFDMCGSAAAGGVIFPALLSELGGGNGATRVNLDTIASPPSVWTRYNYSSPAGADVTGGVTLQLDVICGADPSCAADVYFDNVSVTIGGGPVAGSASGNSCVGGGGGVTLPVDFEVAGGPYVFADFNGGQASVINNPQSNGINVSAEVGQMLKFADMIFGGSTFDLGGALTVPANSLITMKVWSQRIVPVLFKLEGGPAAQVEVNHGGTGWEELTFDFTGIVTGDHTGITFIFDNGTNGAAATDPVNWTFYFDDIDFGVVVPVVVGDGNELLTNGDFDADFASWGTPPGAIVTNRFYEVTANAGGNVFDTNLSQVVTLTKDADYVLTFRAKASVGRSMVVGIGDSGAPFGTELASPALTTEWQSFSYPLTATSIVGGAASRVLFDMGTVASVVNIDDVSLELASAPGVELLTNGDFEADFASWGAPPGAVVINKFFEVTANAGGNVFDTNLSQVVTLTKDVDYVLTFRAKASVNRSMVAGIGDSGAPFGTELANPALTTEWQFYSYPLTATSIVGGAASRVLFDMGTVASIVNIDDVSLQVVATGGGGAALINGDFETGDFTGWTQTPDAGTNVAPGIITLVTSAPASRAGAVARLEAAGDGVAGSQDVLLTQVMATGTLNVGDTIDVSFDLYGSLAGAGGVVFVELIYLDVNGIDTGVRSFVGGGAPKVPSTTWTTYSDSIVVPAGDVSGGVKLQLKSSCGPVSGCGVDAYFDNVSATITP